MKPPRPPTLRKIEGMIASCDSKRAYHKLRSAVASADKHNISVRPYRCPICNDWHLTSKKSYDQKGT